MTIREANINDFDKLLHLYKHLHPDDVECSPEQLKNIWRTILYNPQFFKYFVVEDNGVLVSTCNLTILPNLTRGGRAIGLIENVVTHSDYRNKGNGRVVVQFAIDYAKSRNCYKVMLQSAKERTEAHKFYEAMGFSGSEKKGFVIKF
jgi:GNAT superfamily N-acetyltransferase